MSIPDFGSLPWNDTRMQLEDALTSAAEKLAEHTGSRSFDIPYMSTGKPMIVKVRQTGETRQ